MSDTKSAVVVPRFSHGRAPQGLFERWYQAVATARMVRLTNSLPASFLVLVGAWSVADGRLPSAAWQAAAAMWFVTSYGYVSNDCSDVEEDAINKPSRPLPSAVLTVTYARRLAQMLALGAVLAAGSLTVHTPTLGLASVFAAISVIVLLHVYNRILKGKPFAGNVLVGGLAGCTLLVGAAAVSWPHIASLGVLLPVSCTLGLFVVVREVVKTVEDIPGDRRAGKRTVAATWGPYATALTVSMLAVLTITTSVIPVYTRRFSVAYLVVLSLGLYAPLLYTAGVLWKLPSRQIVRRSLLLLKLGYFAGIAALLVA